MTFGASRARRGDFGSFIFGDGPRRIIAGYFCRGYCENSVSAVNNIYPDTTDRLRGVTFAGYGARTSYIAGPPLSLPFEGARGGYEVKLHAITRCRRRDCACSLA